VFAPAADLLRDLRTSPAGWKLRLSSAATSTSNNVRFYNSPKSYLELAGDRLAYDLSAAAPALFAGTFEGDVEVRDRRVVVTTKSGGVLASVFNIGGVVLPAFDVLCVEDGLCVVRAVGEDAEKRRKGEGAPYFFVFTAMREGERERRAEIVGRRL
jgi:hypothetical protein